MARGIAHVTLVGNLTRDPELRQTPNGASVCQLGVAVNSSYKDASGQWVEKPNYFDVVVWGTQGENCARYLTKGRQIAVDGRLDQRSWEAQDGTQEKQSRDHRRHGDVHRRAERNARAEPQRRGPRPPPTRPRKTTFVTSISGATTYRSSRPEEVKKQWPIPRSSPGVPGRPPAIGGASTAFSAKRA